MARQLHLPTAVAGLTAAAVAVSCGGSSTPAAAPRTSEPAPAPPTVTSSIKDGAALTGAVRWTADTNSDRGIDAVDFLVDGKIRWTEHNAPYSFNDDHQVLATWLLGQGRHTLTVRATDTDGQHAESSVTVTVKAQPPMPRNLVGDFARKVTQADIDRTAREPGRDPNNLPPPGRWALHVRSNGLINVDDPEGSGLDEPVTATAGGVLKVWGPANWLSPPDRQGGFCDPERPGQLRWESAGDAIVITGNSQCADRDSIFVGTWRRI